MILYQYKNGTYSSRTSSISKNNYENQKRNLRMQPTNIFAGFFQIFFIVIFCRFTNNFLKIIFRNKSWDFPEFNLNDIINWGRILSFQYIFRSEVLPTRCLISMILLLVNLAVYICIFIEEIIWLKAWNYFFHFLTFFAEIFDRIFWEVKPLIFHSLVWVPCV